jgi:hypothetical protein
MFLNGFKANVFQQPVSLSELCAAERPKAPLTASEKPVPGYLLALPL